MSYEQKQKRLFIKKKELIILSTIIFFGLYLLFPGFFLKGEQINPADILLLYFPWKTIDSNDHHFGNMLRSDIVDVYIPSLKIITEQFKSLSLPLWNPLVSQGQPFTILIFGGFLNPIRFISLLFTPSLGLSLEIILKIILMSIFMYLYLRKIKLSPLLSLIGAIIYPLAGFNSVWLMWPHTLVTSFAPLLFLGIEVFLEKKTLRSGLIISLAVASMLFGGFPAVAGYFFYLAALYFLFRSTQIASPKKNSKQWFSLCLKFILLVLIGLGITGIQLLPSLEYLKFINISYRKVQSLQHLPLKSAIQLFLPFYWGNPAFYNWKGPSNFNETSGYTGAISLIALSFAPIVYFLGKKLKKRNREQQRLLLFFFFISILSVSIIYKIGPALFLIHNLPVFSTSSSTRLLSVFGFSQAALTTIFLHLLISQNYLNKLLTKKGAKIILGSSLLFLLGLIYSIYKALFHLPSAKNTFSFILSHLPFLRWTNLAWALLQLILFLVMILQRKRGFALKVFIVLVIIDLLFFNYKQNQTTPMKYFYPETPGIQFLKSKMQPGERMAPFDNVFMIPGTQLYYGLNSAFAHSFYSQNHKFLINLFSQNAFRTPTAIIPKVKTTNFLSPIIDLLGIKYIVLPPNKILADQIILQTKHNQPVGPIWQKTSVAQTFQLQNNDLQIKRICFLFATYKRKNLGQAFIKIKDDKEKIRFRTSFSIDSLKDNFWKCFDLEETQPLLPAGRYKIEITTSASKENSFTVYKTTFDSYKEGELFVNGKKIEGDLAFQIFLSSNELNKKYSLAYKGSDLIIYENNSISNGVFLAENVWYYRDLKDFANKISNIDPAKYVLIENRDSPHLPSSECHRKEVTVARYSFNYVEYKTNADCDLILTTPEIWYPGWKVFIDGREAQLLKTNLIFRGAQVPRGEHYVKFSYHPSSLKKGVFISLASLLIVGFILIKPQTKIFSV